jgi:hypothetical protein
VIGAGFWPRIGAAAGAAGRLWPQKRQSVAAGRIISSGGDEHRNQCCGGLAADFYFETVKARHPQTSRLGALQSVLRIELHNKLFPDGNLLGGRRSGRHSGLKNARRALSAASGNSGSLPRRLIHNRRLTTSAVRVDDNPDLDDEIFRIGYARGDVPASRHNLVPDQVGVAGGAVAAERRQGLRRRRFGHYRFRLRVTCRRSAGWV